VLGLLALLPLAVRMALDSGITWDEPPQLDYGNRVLAWYRSGFTDQGALKNHKLFLYGGLFEAPAQWLISTGVLRWGPYETRHVLTALVAVLGMVAAWLTANRIAGARAGLLAAAMLALTPSWVGHGLFNPKDIPFGTAAAFVLYAATCIAMRPAPLRWSDALRAGIALGVALGVRSGGMFLAVYPVLAAFGRLTIDSIVAGRASEPRRVMRDGAVVAGRLLCVLPLCWALMLVAWPWAQLAPFVRPFEAAKIAAHFDFRSSMLFDGRYVRAQDLPLSYLPIWFKVTLPDTYLLALPCALTAIIGSLWARRLDASRGWAVAIVALFAVLPFVGVAVTHPVIYDANRHFLFLMPALAVLAALSFEHVLAHAALARAIRIATLAAVLALSSVTAYDMWSLHPYEYVYFNRMSGGLQRQVSRFETDYWGASYREGFDWVVHNVDRGGTRPVLVGTCLFDGGIKYYRRRWGATRFVFPKNPATAHVYLAFLRGNCRNAKGEILHTVERQGVPLLFVLRR
jgi:4-amino-4-deoxy-L-arabinose transferase-like glycosyltransferase